MDTPPQTPRTRRRWPAFVYEEGAEPDYRFSFANERTFLAWIRTALALLAAGVAVDALDMSIHHAAEHLLASALVALSMATAVTAWVRWSLAERAMRRGLPLPAIGWGALFVSGVLLVCLMATVAIL